MALVSSLSIGSIGSGLVATPARAERLDFRLNARDLAGEGILFSCGPLSPGEAACVPRNDRFRGLASQLGMLSAPRALAPAKTPGYAGFQFGVAWTAGFIAQEEPYWLVTDDAQRTGQPSDLVQGLLIGVQKGLPFGLAVGASLQWLIESPLLAPGVELRWAPLEGLSSWPDLALRAAVSRLVGNRDLNLTTTAFEGILSKGFGMFGMIEVAPYAAWGVIVVTAQAGVIDPTPGTYFELPPMTTGLPRQADVLNDFVFDPIDFGALVNHRLTVGLRVLAHVVELAVQGEFQVIGDEQPVHTVSSKLGLDF